MRTNRPIIVARNILFSLVSITTLWLAMDGHHHWHEIRFSYLASQFSWESIVSGEFNPHQIDTRIDQVGSAGFYYSKILHIWLLRSLFEWISPAKGGFEFAVYLAILSMGLSALVAYAVFTKLLYSKEEAWFASLCFLLLPITPYLAGKLLSEVTALLVVSCSVWTLLVAMRSTGSKGHIWAGLSGLVLICAALSRVDIILSMLGFCFAVFVTTRKEEGLDAVVRSVCISWSVFIVGFVGAMYLLGMEVEAFVRYFKEFTASVRKSVVMSLLGILTFGGLIYLFALFAIFGKERKIVLLLAVWFCLSFGLAMSLASNYMVEPRYLVHGLVPLAGLGGIGLHTLYGKLTVTRFRGALVFVAIIFTLAVNGIVIRLMPYELDRLALDRVVDRILEKDQGAIILIPWAYTDFHYLKMTRPDAPVYNVNSPTVDGNVVQQPAESWHDRFQSWYGKAYISAPADLDRMLVKSPVYYVGWKIYPPAQFLRELADKLGMKELSEVIGQFPLKNHLAQSWVWFSAAYTLEPVGAWRQYEYYKVSFAKREEIDGRAGL